jgi:hypothetical protein
MVEKLNLRFFDAKLRFTLLASLNWTQPPVYKKQAYKQVFNSGSLNLDRFLWTGSFHGRLSDRKAEDG